MSQSMTVNVCISLLLLVLIDAIKHKPLHHDDVMQWQRYWGAGGALAPPLFEEGGQCPPTFF